LTQLSNSDAPLRICLVAHALRRQDGQGRVNFEVARAALERGHELTILAMVCADELLQHPRVRFVQTGSETLPTQLLRNIRFANQSARWLRKHRAKFDVIQANGFVTWEPADVVAVHFVHTAWMQSPFFPFRGTKNPRDWYQYLYAWVNARWEREAFRNAGEIVAVSRRTAREVEAIGVTGKPVRVIYNGVDLAEFHPGTSCRSSFGLPEDVPMALFVGDIQTPRKNLPTVLLSLQQIPELHLAVAAAREGSPYLAMADALGLTKRVHFLGKTSRVSDLMRSVDLMVFPSRYEAHPLVVMEALACGLPTVVSSAIAQGEEFAAACILVGNADDVDAIAREVRHVLADPLARADLSRLGQDVTSQLTWEHTGADYVSIYEELRKS
jgi:glycosyltransferase involved in cell wall biosynthesis